MNLVDAFDAWIDVEIDDLSDDELEAILEILDTLGASELADLETQQVFNEDIDALVAEHGGDDATQTYARRVLRAAFYGDDLKAVAVDSHDNIDEPLDDKHEDDGAELDDEFNDHEHGHADDEDNLDTEPDDHLDSVDNDEDNLDTEPEDQDGLDTEPDDEDDDGLAAEPDDDLDTDDGNLDTEPDDDLDSEPDDEDDDDLDSDDDDGNLDTEPDDQDQVDLDTEPDDDLDTEPDDEDDDSLATEPDDDLDSDDQDDLDTVDDDQEDLDTEPDDEDDLDSDEFEPTTVMPAAEITPVELRPGDELGPHFLDVNAEPVRKGAALRRYLALAAVLGAVGVFCVGTYQLISSLGEETDVVATTPGEPLQIEDEPTPAPTATSEVPATTATAAPAAAAAAPDATPAPTPTPLPLVGLRLSTGDVVLASFDDPSVTTLDMIYQSSDSELSPAQSITWVGDQLGVVDGDGNVSLVDLARRTSDPTIIYVADEDQSAAQEIAPVAGALGVRAENGDIYLISLEEPADEIEVIWDADEEAASATDLSSVDALLPFTLDDGNARMALTQNNNRLIQIWSSEDQPPAFNLGASPTGILLGVGQGAVARFELLDDAPVPLTSVWDPFSTDEAPAIGYSPAGDRTAVVLNNGAVVLADDTGTGERIWDPEETELRALAVDATDEQIVVLLETGTVVRISLANKTEIQSIWDITDETLSPAIQIAVEPQDQ